MKKAIKTIMMLFVASTFVLTSCTDDTDVKDVELTMIPAATSGTYFVSDTLSITLNAKGNSDNSLKSIKISKAIAGQSGVITIFENTKLSGTDFIYVLKDTLQPGEVGINTYTITLTGEKGAVQTKTFTATVRAVGFIESTETPASLYGQSAGAETQQFIALGSFVTYTIPEATASGNEALKNTIDLAFYWGDNNKHSLTSLDDAPMHTQYTGLASFWTSADNKRITGLHKVPKDVIAYNVIEASGTDKDLLIYAEGKTFGKAINNIAANDLILFKTKEGKIGLLKIESASGSSRSTAILTFDGLVQE
jgi:hypothetical protein